MARGSLRKFMEESCRVEDGQDELVASRNRTDNLCHLSRSVPRIRRRVVPAVQENSLPETFLQRILQGTRGTLFGMSQEKLFGD